MNREHVFTFGALSSGIGVGARGFLRAQARLGADTARFRCLGGVDIDPDACRDFEYLTGAPALCADLFKLRPDELAAFWGPRRPDAVFTSPPCKGYSPLIGKEAAAKPKYQELNSLVHVEVSLVLDAYRGDPPPLLIIENVPGIMSRGKHLLIEVRRALAAAGYRFHESTHDCGEIGNLAQHRRRYLLVARREKAVSAFVHQPPKHRVRGCGEELGKLPLPETPSAGPLHRLPKISLLNHVRLAIIPAGGASRKSTMKSTMPVNSREAAARQTMRSLLPSPTSSAFARCRNSSRCRLTGARASRVTITARKTSTR